MKPASKLTISQLQLVLRFENSHDHHAHSFSRRLSDVKRQLERMYVCTRTCMGKMTHNILSVLKSQKYHGRHPPQNLIPPWNYKSSQLSPRVPYQHQQMEIPLTFFLPILSQTMPQRNPPHQRPLNTTYSGIYIYTYVHMPADHNTSIVLKNIAPFIIR